MDSDSDVERAPHGTGDDGGKGRPPSSYGSMKSDDEEEKEDELCDLPFTRAPCVSTGLQLNRSTYPETLLTQTTQQTIQQGACIIDDSFEEELESLKTQEDDDEDMEDIPGLNSPEPPPPVVWSTDQMEDEEAQLERLHPQLDMPHVFKSIQNVLSGLSVEDLANFKIRVCREEKRFNLEELLPQDNLELVDKMIEVLGHASALKISINSLKSIEKRTEAQDLEDKCRRVLLRFQLKQEILRKFRIYYEGVPQHGRQQPLDTIFVQPRITRRLGAGIDSASDGDSSLANMQDLLRLHAANGKPVRTLVTTGIPGIGLSVVAARFSMGWAEGANKDLQFLVPLSFKSLWILKPDENFSFYEVLRYFYQGFANVKFLEEPDCRFLILMDSFDCYLGTLDWKNAPVLPDIHTPAPMEIMIVNLIRGNLLPSACIWILGRQGAVSTIPPEHIDAVTDIHGFSDEMKDEFLRKRFDDEELSAEIMSHYKRTPILRTLCEHPFICWMVAVSFQRCFNYLDYGKHPPRLTPFYIRVLIVQTNRKLNRYRGQVDNAKWTLEDIQGLLCLGKMALTMVEKQVWEFSEEDLKEHSLDVKEMTVLSGLCTELPSQDTSKRKQFCFIHKTFQEFMAAMYIFTVYMLEGRNVLKEPRRMSLSLPISLSLPKSTRSVANLLRVAVQRTLGSSHLDMVFLFLCGMMSPGDRNDQHDMLRGKLFPSAPQLAEMEEGLQLLKREVERAPVDRRANLQESLRELEQDDE